MLNKRFIARQLRRIASEVEKKDKIEAINAQIKNEPIKFMNWFNQNFGRNGDCLSYIDTKANAKSLMDKYRDESNCYLIDAIDCKNVENSKIVFIYDCGTIANFIGIRSFDDFNQGENINADKSFTRFTPDNGDDASIFKFDESSGDSVSNPLFGYGERLLEEF